jgi:Fe-S-cluster containining protein
MLSQRSARENAIGAAGTICMDCVTSACCKSDPAFLTERDIAGLIKLTGLHEQDFVDRKVVGGLRAAFLKFKQDGSACVFFDDASGRCSVYGARPTDCRLFPFDLDVVEGKLNWIKYQLQACALQEEPPTGLIDALEAMALADLGDDALTYAMLESELWRTTKFDVLRPILETPREAVGESNGVG